MDNLVVLFNKPIWFVREDNDIRIVVEVYGYTLPDQTPEQVSEHVIQGYLDYLCGVSKWEQEGNSVKGLDWISNLTGETYDYDDPFVQKIVRRAKQQKQITFLVFNTNKILDKDTVGIYDGEFLVSRSLYNNIMEYGVIVDVQK